MDYNANYGFDSDMFAAWFDTPLRDPATPEAFPPPAAMRRGRRRRVRDPPTLPKETAGGGTMVTEDEATGLEEEEGLSQLKK